MKRVRNRFSVLAWILLCALGVSLVLNAVFIYQLQKGSKVSVVYDGDSFELTDGRRVRLLGVDAPEKDRCGYEEAKNMLTSLVLGKKISLHSIIVDDYGRLVANVTVVNLENWTKYITWFFRRNFSVTHHDFDATINTHMVSLGLAKNLSVASPIKASLDQASEDAKNRGLGIYSPQCRSLLPSSDCIIKGNIRQGEKAYYLERCKAYDQVIVDLSFGDVWLCSESQARDMGFSLSKTCR